MNIELSTRKKMNDILNADFVRVNENFDRMSKDLLDMATALGDYEIDLTADVTGVLPLANTDVDGIASELNITGYTPISTERRSCWLHCTPGTIVNMGIAAPTETGAVGSNVDATSVWRQYTSGAGAGAQAGHDMVTFVRIGHNPKFVVYLRTGATITGIRHWIGLSSAGMTNADTHAAHCLAFRFSTVAGDTGFIGVSRDGASQSVTAAMGTYAASTVYRLTCEFDGTTATFTVEAEAAGTSASATLAATLPGSTTSLEMSNQIFTTAGGARSWEFGRFYLEGN